MKTLYLYEIGKLYSPRTKWPELAQYNFRGGEHELILFLNAPTRDEIYDVKKGAAHLALYVERNLIILLYKFGQSIRWSDAPYSIHLVPKEERVEPAATDENSWALLHILLVDASNGILKAMRVISLSPEFTSALHRAIKDQAAMPFTVDSYNAELAGLYAGYSSETLAQMAPIHFETSN